MRRVAGIDVGGTFTDLLLYEAGARASRVRLAKIPTTAANQADGVLAAIAEAGVSPARSRPRHPRHHHHHQRRAGAQGRQGRARHHARLPRHPRARPAHAAQALRHDRHVRAADPARAAHRDRRAHERARARWSPRSTRRSWRRPCARCWPWAARASSSISCMPTPTRRTSCAPARSRARCGPTTTSRSATRCCRSSASTSAAPRRR